MEHIFEEYSSPLFNFEDDIEHNDSKKNVFGITQNSSVSQNIFNSIKHYSNSEYQYLQLLQTILDNGKWEYGRNGRVKSIFGHTMRFSLKNNSIPILTTKKTAWKTCLKELLWFISGKTNNKLLQAQGVHIWDANANPEFLEGRGLNHYEDGELGPIYGHQWRHFGAPWKGDRDYYGLGVDQLQNIIDELKNPETRTSRRIILSAWNPCQLDKMALPPCHIMCQFNVHDGNKLSCALFQRSGDSFLGVPFNIASYSFLTHLLAHHCGLEAYEFVHFLGNAHLYEQHVDAAQLQLSREPNDPPCLHIKQLKENINDYKVDDFEINNYFSHDAIKVDIIA